MNKPYFIFERHTHSVIYFVQAMSVKEAICKYILDQRSDNQALFVEMARHRMEW